MNFEKRLEELFIELPELPAPSGAVVPAVSAGKCLYLGNHYPYAEGKLTLRGRLGFELSVDQGVSAARYALIQALSNLKSAAGSVNKVLRIVQLNVAVASAPDFRDHEKVADGASQLLQDIFGSSGKHSRIVTGVQSLPQNASVAVSLIVELK